MLLAHGQHQCDNPQSVFHDTTSLYSLDARILYRPGLSTKTCRTDPLASKAGEGVSSATLPARAHEIQACCASSDHSTIKKHDKGKSVPSAASNQSSCSGLNR